MDTIQASTFKAKCLALLDEVAATHKEVIITKHGRPVAKLVPILEHTDTAESVILISTHDTDYFSTGEAWDAES